MKRIVRAAAVLSACCFVTGIYAEDHETKVAFDDLPSAVQRAATEQSKNTTVRGYSKEIEDGKTYYEVELRRDGKTRDVLLDPSGAVVEIEQQVNWSSIPAAVQRILEKQANGGRIDKVEAVTKRNQVTYEAVVSLHGKRREIGATSNGSMVKPD